MKMIKTDDEKQFLQGLVEPFHPDVEGVRVPSILPRETLTFNIFKSHSLVGNTNDPILMVANYELGCEDQIIILEDAAGLLNNVPQFATVRTSANGQPYGVQVISTGKDAATFRQSLTVINDT